MFHAPPGCDTTSYVFEVGKKKLFQMIMKNIDVLELISSLTNFASVDKSMLSIVNNLLR